VNAGAGGAAVGAGVAGTLGVPGGSGGALAGTSGAAPGAGAGGSAGIGPSEGGAGGVDVPENPDGVVETSGHYLVFTLGPQDGSNELMLLDLEGSGTPVQVNVPDTTLVLPAISQSGEFLIYAHGSAPIEGDLLLNRFTASGYVPGRVVGGFEGRPGLHAARGFDASSRFVAFSRTGDTPGLDIVDAARNVRHFSADLGPFATLLFEWAPAGSYFNYTLDPDLDDTTPAKNRTYLAELTNDGASEPVALPPNVVTQHFSADGRRLFFLTKDADGLVGFGYLEPPDAQVQFYQGSMPESYGTDFYVEPGGESVVSQLTSEDTPRRAVVERLFADEAREPEPLWDSSWDPMMGSIAVNPSPSGALALLSLYDVCCTYGHELLRGSDHFDLGGPAPSFFGDKLVYTSAPSPATIATLTDAGIDVTVLDETPDYPGLCAWGRRPTTKVSLLSATGLHLWDLETGRGRDISVTDPGATLGCAVFSPSEDACAYVEATTSFSKIFVVRFGPDGPSEPELALGLARTVNLKIVHP
jgi:hypothetical protein